MEIKPADVKKLRDQTGAGLMDCKNALTEAEGVLEKAVIILKEKGLAAAAKRSGRATQEGRIFTSIKDSKAVILELSCETDFVARNENFTSLGNSLAEEIISSNASDITEKMQTIIAGAISKLKENMALKRFKILEIAENEYVVDYIHGVGSIGVLVKFKTDNKAVFENEQVKTFAFDCALHIAAFNPQALSPEQVSAGYISEMESIYKKQAENLDKPENVLQGIIKGKLNKHLSEICFLNQPFVKDDKKKVSQVIAETGKTAGGAIEAAEFVYYKVGD